VRRQQARHVARLLARVRVRRRARRVCDRLLRIPRPDGADRRRKTVGATETVSPAPPYEREIALDLVRRVLFVTPVVLLVAGVVRGVDGLVSAAIGLLLVAA